VVKYHGLIQDKRLTWKMKNVMNKPYRTLWTCGGTFGKTQGGALDLHHGDQTHTDLQLHGLMAEVLMQCPQDRAHKVTETACLAITGVMKMTPTVVLEVVLERPPLHVMNDMETQVGIYKQKCNSADLKPLWSHHKL